MSNIGTPLPRSTPLQEGVSAISIALFNRALERSSAHMRGYVLLRHGKVAAERYWEPYSAADKNFVYSAAKSFTTTAAGMACDAGLLDLDAPVLSFFPDKAPEEPNENLRAMCVRHLLSMNSGHGTDTTIPMVFSPDPDWVKCFLQMPVDHEPGSYFEYNSGATYVVSAILQQITGETVYDYLKKRLFEPLGFGDTAHDLSPQGVFPGGWGLVVRLEDLAKLGQLYLDKGVYNGQRFLSEEWVALASANHSDNGRPGRENEPADWRQGYGFQFWRCQHNAFRADGAAGQYCIVMPEQDAVLAMMSEVANMQELMDPVWEFLLPGFSNTSAERESAVSGKTIQLKRMAPFDTACLRFSDRELELTFTEDDEIYSQRFGRGFWLENVGTLHMGERLILPTFALDISKELVSAYFHWKDEATLELCWAYRETPHRERLVCYFEDDTVSFLCHSSVSVPRDEDDWDFEGKIV